MAAAAAPCAPLHQEELNGIGDSLGVEVGVLPGRQSTIQIDRRRRCRNHCLIAVFLCSLILVFAMLMLEPCAPKLAEEAKAYFVSPIPLRPPANLVRSTRSSAAVMMTGHRYGYGYRHHRRQPRHYRPQPGNGGGDGGEPPSGNGHSGGDNGGGHGSDGDASESFDDRNVPRNASLTGHYARLDGICAEQARRAFRGEVSARSNDGWAIATFAGGCFWGPQLRFDRVEGVVATSVGYTQGDLERPNYNAVCSGRTGHTEAVQVLYDERKVSYALLLEKFWGSIDPTIVNGQGNDYGTQYRTGIYYHTSEQKKQAQASLAQQQKKHNRLIATEVTGAKVFWPAETNHQNYLMNGGRLGRKQSNAKGCTDRIRCYG